MKDVYESVLEQFRTANAFERKRMYTVALKHAAAMIGAMVAITSRDADGGAACFEADIVRGLKHAVAQLNETQAPNAPQMAEIAGAALALLQSAREAHAAKSNTPAPKKVIHITIHHLPWVKA